LGKFVDLTGQRFGRLTAIRRIENNKNGNIMWLCKCDCDGKEVAKEGKLLKNNKIKSCGCLQHETRSINGKNNKKFNTYDLTGDYGIGYTYNTNEKFIFDLEDYNKIKEYCWRTDSRKYIVTREDRKVLRLHRLIMNTPQNKVIDHVNHNTLDNRKSNLRICTQQENTYNSSLRKDNKSGVTGVYWNEINKTWDAQIRVNRKNIRLGSYNTFHDAVKSRKEAAEKYFKVFKPYVNEVINNE
jgi:hypothetical protein